MTAARTSARVNSPSVRAFFHSLRFRLLALVLLALIPALALILYNAAEERSFATREVEAGSLRLARLVAADHQRMVEEIRQLLITLSYLPETGTGRQPACNQVFAELLSQYPQYANLAVVGPNGALLCNAVQPGAELNLSGFPVINKALSELEFVYGGYQSDPVTGQPAIHFALPIIDESDTVLSVIVASLNLEWLNQLVTASQMPADSVLLVLDNQGRVLVDQPGGAWVGKDIDQNSLAQTMLRLGEGSLEIGGLDGVERLYGFTRLSGSSAADLYVGVGISKAAAFARVNQALMRHLTGLGIVVTLALAAAWLGGDLFVVRQVQVLVDTTRRMAAGDLSARTGLAYGRGELDQLARAFDQLGAALEQREIERAQTELEIKHHSRDLAALNTITASVNSSLDVSEVFDSLKRLLSEQFNVPGGAIFTYDEGQQILRLESAWGVPAASLADVKEMPALQHHYRRVIVARSPYYQPDIRYVEPYASTGLGKSRPYLNIYLCIPLVGKGQIMGVIDMFSQAQDTFSQDQVNLFTTMGQEVGVALQNARLFEEVRASRERLRHLSQQLINVQETERRHIARELHDEIGQALTAVKVNLQTIGKIAGDQTVTPHLEESIALVDRTVQQVRNLSLDLRPSLLDDLGVVSAARWYLDRQAQRAGLDGKFHASTDGMRFPPALETTCFRIVQEALTNVVRHARATRVSVSIEQREHELLVHISDDGVGFQVEMIQNQAPTDATLGLLGMKERVELVGGSLEIQSKPGIGTEILACLPVGPDLWERFSG
jgi:signal transduction histidine kinase